LKGRFSFNNILLTAIGLSPGGCGKMLKKSYILNFIIDAKSNIQNKIFVISVLGLGGVVFDSAWGVITAPPPARKKHCLK
jgi:hypothetical protein